jgi:hypothetical protein
VPFAQKKRESGIYAATEAARLNRLNALAKLLQITKTDAHVAEGKDEGDSGWCWFACLGLLDPNDKSACNDFRLRHLDC